jgi:hypothetical protein
VGAQDEVALESALTVVWNIHDVGRSFFSEDGENVLERVAHAMKQSNG